MPVSPAGPDNAQVPSTGAVPAASSPTAASLAALAAGHPFINPLDGRVILRTLIKIRWIAIVGQLIAVGVVALGFGFSLPVAPILAAIGASVVLNAAATIPRGIQQRLTDLDASLYLAYDILQLSLLLYLTGGIINPFAVLLLAPVTVGASVLTRFSVVALSGLTLACSTILTLWHFPLPWMGETPTLHPVYTLGLWAALSFSVVFIVAYVFRVAEEARRINEALTATQMALAREQRLSALGALAAAAAHELGTPLGTIAVVAKELLHDVPHDSPWREDMELLCSQSERCRRILADLARDPEADGGTPFDRLPVTALVEAAALPHKMGGITFDIRGIGLKDACEPQISRLPEIMHGLGNLIQNALQFATRRVTVNVTWDQKMVSIAVIDDGPGFPSHVLSRIGEPYISERSESAGHMGLGIFIAATLLERTGAKVEFSNNRSGGARVVLRWERAILEGNTVAL